jgi:hypothetical protein
MRQSFVAAIVLFAFSVQTISGQTQTTPTSETSESDEVRRLRKTVSDMAYQLTAQQVQTNALQSCFAEQIALLMKLLNPNAPPPISRGSRRVCYPCAARSGRDAYSTTWR